MFPTHEQERQYLRSRIPQSNYVTATSVAAAANFKEMLCRDKNLTSHEVKAEDNKDESTGHMQATDEYKTVHDTTVQKEIAICAEEIGRDLLLATGSVVTTQPDAGAAPAVRRHSFKVQDLAVSKQAPSMTLIEIVGSVINQIIPSCVVEELSLKGEGTSRLVESMSLRGSGLIEDQSTLDASDITPLSGLHYFTHSMCKLVIADSVSLDNDEDFSAGGNYLANWGLNLKKNLLADQGYIPGAARYFTDGDSSSGVIRSECLVESYMFGMDFLARLLANSRARTLLKTKQKLDVQIDIIGDQIDATDFNYQLSIHAPRVLYDTVEYPQNNGMYMTQIKPKIFFDTVTSKDVEIVLTNKVTSYTV